MSINDTSEKRFESDVESFFLSSVGGYTKTDEFYDAKRGLFVGVLIDFVQRTQPKEWKRYRIIIGGDPVPSFCLAFDRACEASGLLSVLRDGFTTRGVRFRVCYFQPESGLNEKSTELYGQNVCNVVRQWRYSSTCGNSVDMVLVFNGIPIFALELKNQYTGQTVDDAKRQWMNDRNPRELCFNFNRRILGYFCVDHSNVLVATKLDKGKTYFLPFDQGSNGAGAVGGAGNPPNPNGYATSYLWERVLQKDSALDILQKFLHLQVKEETQVQGDGEEKRTVKKTLIFPRYHQLDVVRKLVADVRAKGSGNNYLIQHSAGSGKSNSIAWTAYRLASLHGTDDRPIFASVVIVTDRTVLDRQLQETISSFDHVLGTVETIGENKTSRDLLAAINDGCRIIVTTLQKFPVIYEEVESTSGKRFAVIVDEAHSSQTGSSAKKLKVALADTDDALREYAELEEKEADELDPNDKLLRELLVHGKHKNLSFFAFTATPKSQTLEVFGDRQEDGTFRPFHVYSMKQAIEEGFILNVLQNYMTYKTCFRIAKTTPDNPEVPESRAMKLIRRYEELHPTNFKQKAQIIVETFVERTSKTIGGRGKMMVVTSSRLAAVRYCQAIDKYAQERGYDAVATLVAFSGVVRDGDLEYTESGLNVRKDGTHISEARTKSEFHENFNVLVVAEKYQTGFDEPLLHTMIVDKKLRGVKCVQTLSRLNRVCPGKNDTFVLDFVNTADDVRDAFSDYYTETTLSEEIDVDKIYELRNELRAFGIYSEPDVDAFCKIYYSPGKQDAVSLGRTTSVLKPVANRYNNLDADDRDRFRSKTLAFVKQFGYVSQICRTFDAQTQREYVFLSYLLKLLPQDKTRDFSIEKALRLEFYKLTRTFKGEITLEDAPGVFAPAKNEGKTKPEELKPIEVVIRKVNELYAGEFTEADAVIADAILERLKQDKKLKRIAKSTDRNNFVLANFPEFFERVACECFTEQKKAFESLFQDAGKYRSVQSALADVVYRELRKEQGERS